MIAERQDILPPSTDNVYVLVYFLLGFQPVATSAIALRQDNLPDLTDSGYV